MFLTEIQKNNIISHLKRNYDLPEQGFVAGQSVASLIYNELDLSISGPINDIDVFTTSDLESLYALKARMRTISTSETISFFDGGSFSKTQFLCSDVSRSYRVIRSVYTDETKLINLIKVHFNNGSFSEIDILKSFDFNCCSVGFDLETETFFYTQSFVDFCKTKQLRVLSSHTPFHSILRLNKKIIDIKGCFCDKKQEQEVLLFSYYLNKKSTIVGEKFLTLFNNFKDDFISKLFDLKINDRHCKKEFLPLFKGKVYHNIEMNNDFVIDNFPFLKSFFYNQSNLDCSYFKTMSSICSVHFYHLFSESSLFTKKYKQNVLNFISDTKFNGSINNGLLFENKPFKTISFILFISMITDSDSLQNIKKFPSQKECSKLLTLFKSHPLFFSKLHKDESIHSMSTIDFILNIRKLVNTIKKNDKKSFVYGLFENNIISLKNIFDNIDKDENELKDLFINNLDMKYNQVLKNRSLFGLSFSQLITFDDFQKESDTMKHCILGYFNNCTKKNHNYYYHITTPFSESTLEIGKFIYQHRGFRNENINFLNKLIGFYILSLLNNDYKLFFKSLKSDAFYFNVRYLIKNHIFKFKRKFLNKKTEVNNLTSEYIPPMQFDDDIPF